jgi:hypothetical protein
MADPVLPELARAAMMLTARQPNRDFMQAIPGGGGSERSANPSWDAMSNAEKAAYYSANPTMAGITQFGQKALGMTSYGMLQNAMFPNFVAEQQAIAQGFPSVEAYSGSRNFGKESSLPAGGVVSPGMPKSNNFVESLFNSILPSSAVQLNPAPVETQTATPNPYGGVNPALSSTGSGFAGADIGAGGGFTGGVGTGTSGGTPADAADLGYNQGGMVDAENLMGQAPGPDDGYGALQGGEYVIKKAAVDKYGQEMLDAINNGTFQFEQSLINFMATPAK